MIDMLTTMLPAGFLLMLGGIAACGLPHAARQVWLLALIALSAWQCWQIDIGTHITTSVMGIDLILSRATAITKPFALVFHIAAALNVIYAMHERARTSAVAGMVYAGAAIAALYAGDFLTLFMYWEITAFASVLLILAGNTTRSFAAAMRYLLMQLASGVLLLAGAAVLWQSDAGLAIAPLSLGSWAGGLIFVAFGIKAAFPFLNGWLQDAYPEASITGTVVLSAFTTKLAIYMLALCFAGTKALIYIGVVMTIFPVFFAVIENDLRRVLAFSLNNQLGFMVVGIGIGTELALNGTVAHAFAHIIYKSLLFMSMGAVLLRAGTIKASELGGLARKMPLTTIFCIIGALSISSFPLLSGFATKSLTLGAVAQENMLWIWLALLFASAGVLEHSGIKIPFFAFFGHKREWQVREAPLNMLVAMGIAAALCIAIGIAPNWLYALLPYAVDYDAFATGHVLAELQLLLFAVLAFVFLWVRRLYPAERDTTVLNSDWFLRRAIPRIVMPVVRGGWRLWCGGLFVAQSALAVALREVEQLNTRLRWSTGAVETGIAAGVFLAVFAALLLLFYTL